jgi:sugar phosphate permease
MEESGYKIYRYRWVVLVAYMLITMMNQLLWITFAAITKDAVGFYHVNDLSIGFLSMIFMIVYVVVSFPASWAIDTWGIRIAVGIGAALTGIFGLMRGLLGTSYTWVLIAQIGIAIGQPFILNAVTSVAAKWFPVKDRATAAGLGSLSIYVGILGGLLITPYLITPPHSIQSMLVVYGIASMVAAVIFIIFAKDRPATPPCAPGEDARSLVVDGLKDTLRNKKFILLMVVFFIGLGAFNAVTTWIENVVAPRGFSSQQAGIAGGIMIAGGVIGALVLPMISDKLRKRVPFIVLAVAGATLGLVGVTFFTSYALLLVASGVLGFFLLSAGPIGFTYGAEITHPAPEGTSNGLLILMGQISGILFIVGMDALKSPKTGSMTLSLVIMGALMIVCLLLTSWLKEAKKDTGKKG